MCWFIVGVVKGIGFGVWLNWMFLFKLWYWLSVGCVMGVIMFLVMIWGWLNIFFMCWVVV